MGKAHQGVELELLFVAAGLPGCEADAGCSSETGKGGGASDGARADLLYVITDPVSNFR